MAALASVLSVALPIASGVLGAVGRVQEGKAQEKAAKFDAKVMEQQAERERQAAEVEASDFRRRFSRRKAGSIAQLGGSGVAMAGSPLLVLDDFEKEAALQSARLLNAGDVRSSRLEQQAELTRFGGRSARRAGSIRAGTSLLGGFGRAAGAIA